MDSSQIETDRELAELRDLVRLAGHSARADEARAELGRKLLVIRERWERENASQKVKQLSIKTPGLMQLIGNLSGGRQPLLIVAAVFEVRG